MQSLECFFLCTLFMSSLYNSWSTTLKPKVKEIYSYCWEKIRIIGICMHVPSDRHCPPVLEIHHWAELNLTPRMTVPYIPREMQQMFYKYWTFPAVCLKSKSSVNPSPCMEVAEHFTKLSTQGTSDLHSFISGVQIPEAGEQSNWWAWGKPCSEPRSALHSPGLNPSLLNRKLFAFWAGYVPKGQARKKTWRKP